jgi:hypothetical protein
MSGTSSRTEVFEATLAKYANCPPGKDCAEFASLASWAKEADLEVFQQIWLSEQARIEAIADSLYKTCATKLFALWASANGVELVV